MRVPLLSFLAVLASIAAVACSSGALAGAHDGGSPATLDDAMVSEAAPGMGEDGAANDAGAVGDASDAGSFVADGATVPSCPSACPGSCGPGSYCQWVGDGMGNGGGGCMAAPPQCQQELTCACLLAPDAGNGGCTCTESEAGISVTCC